MRLRALSAWEDGYVRVDAVIGAGVKTSYGKAKIPDEAPKAAD